MFDRSTRPDLADDNRIHGKIVGFVEALAAQVMLLRRGLPAELHLGVPSERLQTQLLGHAWVISEGEMVATGTVVNAGRTVWVAEATLSDDHGRQLGRGSGTFMRSRLALSEAMGYSGKD